MEERQVVVPATLAGEGGEGFVSLPCKLQLLQIKAVVRSSIAFGTHTPRRDLPSPKDFIERSCFRPLS